MNDRPCGLEWLAAPLLLFTRSDRGLFLINYIPFLLLPGLLFSVCTRLGVRPRVAWHWMWLLPTGYNFLLQAGSLGNDTTPAFYALAAVDFGLRAWKSRRPADLWLSILSAAFLTGAKLSNLPLLLPCAIVVFPCLPLLLRRPAAAFVLVLLAASVSLLPTAALNTHYSGDWTGLAVEHSVIEMKHPIVGIWGNTLASAEELRSADLPARALVESNGVYPSCPRPWWRRWWPISSPDFILLGELPTEDVAGVGFGVSVLADHLGAGGLGGCALPRRRRGAGIGPFPAGCAGWCCWRRGFRCWRISSSRR